MRKEILFDFFLLITNFGIRKFTTGHVKKMLEFYILKMSVFRRGVGKGKKKATLKVICVANVCFSPHA